MFDYFWLLNVILLLFLKSPVYMFMYCPCGMHVVVELENF